MKGKIAEVRGLKEGEAAISPRRASRIGQIVLQVKDFADEVRDRTGGIPIGYKLSAQHIEKDIEAALLVGVDYIILDGRGGGTGAAPIIFRDNISVPTIPALARARKFLDESRAQRRLSGDHGRSAQASGFRQSHGLGRGCDCGVERGDASDWLYCHARLPYQ